MTQFYEKLVYGVSNLLAGALMMISGVFSSGEWRWLSLTGAASVFTACAVSLVLKAPNETMRLTAGRGMIAVLFGVFATRAAVVHWGLDAFNNDAVLLMGGAGVMTIIGFTVGYVALLKLNTRSGDIADKALDKYLPKDDPDEQG